MLTFTTIRTTCQLENCLRTVPFSSTLFVSNQNMIFQSNFKSAPSFFFFSCTLFSEIMSAFHLEVPSLLVDFFFNVHILKFTFCVVGFFVLYQIHSIRYPPLQNISSTLKIPMCPFSKLLPHSPLFFCTFSFTFWRMSYEEICIICNLSGLPFFTWEDAFKFYPSYLNQ